MASELALVGPGGRIQLDRRTIELLAEMFVGFLDITEPEPDLEEPGLEDSFVHHPANGPGCPISDVDMSIEDERHDDDDPAEEDDPLEQNGDELDGTGAEDEILGGRHGASGPGCPISDPDYGIEDMPEDAREGDVCDDTRPIADPQAYREHQQRLRRDRTYVAKRTDCRSYGRGIYEDRRLIHEPEVPSKNQLLRRKRGVPRRPRA